MTDCNHDWKRISDWNCRDGWNREAHFKCLNCPAKLLYSTDGYRHADGCECPKCAEELAQEKVTP